MRIVVHEIVGDRGKIDVEWQNLHDLISPILARGEEVELDFQGVRYFDVQFLSVAIGQLLRDHALDRVKALLHVANLDDLHRRMLEGVITHASRYYTEPRYREAIDRSLARMFEDQ
jgi:hypothetical protein